MKKNSFIVLVLTVVLIAGCDSFRFAPGQVQKQNAWLHNRTAQATSDMAKAEDTSGQLQDLTTLSEVQSRAFVSDYGLPKEFPPAGSVEEILAESNQQLAKAASQQAGKRPDVWQITDSAIELGIGAAGLLGGVYGMRIARFLKQARDKSKALREIIGGNEIFKQQNTESKAAFKTAHNNQSPQTRQIVAEVKNS